MTSLGLTLPSFVDDPTVPLGVAAAAEAAGLDGVFVYDHVFRGDEPHRRPALEATALLGALAASTATIHVGTLVSRATLRPPATLAVGLETAQRIAPGRVIATLGAGDAQSREENESFGLPFGSLDDRVAALEAARVACSGRGFPVWVGGTHPRVRAVASRADGWNRWGGDPERFAVEAGEVSRAAERPITCSWGGLFVIASTEEAASAKAARLNAGDAVFVGGPDRIARRLASYAEAGAEWVIVAPVDSSNPDNAALLGEAIRPLLPS